MKRKGGTYVIELKGRKKESGWVRTQTRASGSSSSSSNSENGKDAKMEVDVNDVWMSRLAEDDMAVFRRRVQP